MVFKMVEEGKIVGNNFFSSPTMIYTLSKLHPIHCKNYQFEQVQRPGKKFLHVLSDSFCPFCIKWVTLCHTIPTFNDPKKGKHFWESRKSC